jgi:hypothetical protein
MDNALGIKPEFDSYIKSARMCGSCHTINLPVLDNPKPVNNDCKLKPPFNNFDHNMEQATYLEWLNSAFQNEFPNPRNKVKTQSCQDCHMPSNYVNSQGTLDVPLIQQPIAAIEDDQFPATENRAAPKDIRVRLRGVTPNPDDRFARHQFQGLNATLLEMLYQNATSIYSAQAARTVQANPILGVRQNDYMLGYVNMDLQNAIDAFLQQAKASTADIDLQLAPASGNRQELIADVTVTNKTGHRFPSGVGFRRAFIELKVVEKSSGQTIWCSGCTNELGVIVAPANPTEPIVGPQAPLPSEFFRKECKDDQGRPAQCYQPHFFGQPRKSQGTPEFPITRQDQVQIYEELVQNTEGQFTTSFIRRDHIVKDNRLLPLGWSSKGPPGANIPECFLETTFPDGVRGDPRYKDGSGTSLVRYKVALNGRNPADLIVTATLYYQSIPPYYLMDRFTQAPDYPATKRLYYLTSMLNTQRPGSSIPNWKMMLVSDSAQFGAGQ